MGGREEREEGGAERERARKSTHVLQAFSESALLSPLRSAPRRAC